MSMERYEAFMKHLPVESRDKTLIALKGHLLLETALREYIYRRVSLPERLEKKQMSFASLIDFASCLEFNARIDWIWKALRKANQIRNQLAHQLEPAKLEETEDALVEYVEANDGEFSVAAGDDLMYEKLALIFFQLFDVLISAPTTDENIQQDDMKKYKGLSFDQLLGSASNGASLGPLEAIDKVLGKKPGYTPPPRSKKRRRQW